MVKERRKLSGFLFLRENSVGSASWPVVHIVESSTLGSNLFRPEAPVRKLLVLAIVCFKVCKFYYNLFTQFLPPDVVSLPVNADPGMSSLVTRF